MDFFFTTRINNISKQNKFHLRNLYLLYFCVNFAVYEDYTHFANKKEFNAEEQLMTQLC